MGSSLKVLYVYNVVWHTRIWYSVSNRPSLCSEQSFYSFLHVYYCLLNLFISCTCTNYVILIVCKKGVRKLTKGMSLFEDTKTSNHHKAYIGNRNSKEHKLWWKPIEHSLTIPYFWQLYNEICAETSTCREPNIYVSF